MKPGTFPEKTKTLQPPPGMKDCDPLDVWSDGEHCVSLWRPTLMERLKFLWYGKLWVFVHSGHTQPAIALSVEKSVFVTPAP